MITFIRIDDRIIHGQTCTRWALSTPAPAWWLSTTRPPEIPS